MRSKIGTDSTKNSAMVNRTPANCTMAPWQTRFGDELYRLTLFLLGAVASLVFQSEQTTLEAGPYFNFSKNIFISRPVLPIIVS